MICKGGLLTRDANTYILNDEKCLYMSKIGWTFLPTTVIVVYKWVFHNARTAMRFFYYAEHFDFRIIKNAP